MGLELNIGGELTSRPYVQMTLDMLQEAGISYEWTGNRITIAPQSHLDSTLTIEPDWSAASYWYAIAALSDDAIISLKNLKAKSLQGDKAIAGLMKAFGIETTFADDEIILKKTSASEQADVIDLKECPDLAQTLIVCCAALGRNARFTGLETLRIKETDRIAALQNELAPMGIRLTENAGRWDLDSSRLHFPAKMSVQTYHDHRMAMAFAPLALKVREVELQDAKVVGKSYPHFWKDLENAGFDIR
jgi:3-phosphoshikimate 1-carboxyvinyltransferase